LQLGRQLRRQSFRLERRVAGRLAPERIQTGREVAVHTVRLDERHGGRNATEKLAIGGGGSRRDGRLGRDRGAVAAVCLGELPEPLDKRLVMQNLLRRGLEQRSPGRIDRLGSDQVLGEELLNEARIQIFEP
jgi:hypothetical protein